MEDPTHPFFRGVDLRLDEYDESMSPRKVEEDDEDKFSGSFVDPEDFLGESFYLEF
jgi:hypothetical protein